MTYNYLWLVNRLCERLNEVPLDSSTFANANGVYADFKSSINAAIGDIHQREDNEWPFNWVETSFTTVIGQTEYTKAAAAKSIDWDSFYVKRPALSVYTITQTGGLATVTVLAGHQVIEGDSVYITGANQEDYNGDIRPTVISPTQFTFEVDASTVSPATGTIIMYPGYATKKLTWINIDTYRKEGRLVSDTEMFRTTDFGIPEVVVRKPDNNFIITPKTKRVQTIVYDYFTMPEDLVLYSDVPLIPEDWKETIVNAAIVHGNLFRDNIELAAKAEDTFEKDVVSMRRILIDLPYYMRVVD